MKKWLGAAKHSATSSTHSLTALEEPQAHVETAEAELSKGNSPFHKLGQGVVAFLRATLGFEQDIMREASERLGQAESAAYDHQRRADKDAYHSKIYPPGSEYALCLAESQLMSAVVAVLNESLSESIKGFYKLRKAYVALQEIADAEKRYLKGRSSTSVGSTSTKSTVNSAPSIASTSNATSVSGQTLVAQDEDDDDDFVDADESIAAAATPTTYQGHLESKELESKLGNLSIRPASSSTQVPAAPVIEEDDFSEFSNHPVDLFIHSGSNLCFGLLQLMLSLIPPAFSKLLYIIGFKGDRELGIQMLWRATQYSNVNGAMAGLIALGYYNVTVGFCDITTSDAYPKERLTTLLFQMRKRYPESRLWRLEEARMMAADKQLEDAVKMCGTDEKSPLKQVEALQWFEKSLNCMYLHRYEECATSFLTCVELNNWSHGLYYYIAGACYVELYREAKSVDAGRAKRYADRATELLRKVPVHAGKKRFMARQLPFDAFVTRKINKWEERSKTRGIAFVDAVGVAPVEEIIYFWAGFKRMRKEHLVHSLERLAWSEQNGCHDNAVDELATLSLLRATVTRWLGDTATARQILETQVLNHEWSEFKGGNKDNWSLPVAHYEMSVIEWIDAGGERGNKQQLEICSRWVEKAAKWEAYDLDARVGLKVTTARETLKKCGITAITA
ncbi:hypothetical protein D6D20_06350 [Aureobasidium pullulans]|uniref:Inclusion body clearance protein IML2 n=1 Tax=Aureobasidium pullulans TaxID=5580 RepID=A0A4S8Z4U8_AURPU|nr:hypothetical protein D6D20_06350 [Aureobasidium pullulans]